MTPLPAAAPTDTERLDFLQAQRNVTLWVGWDYQNGHTAMPLFGGTGIREMIDLCIQEKQAYDARQVSR